MTADDVLKLRQVRSGAALLNWLSSQLLACLYPGAPLSRVSIPIDLLLVLADRFEVPKLSFGSATVTSKPVFESTLVLQPGLSPDYSADSFYDALSVPMSPVFAPESTMSLLNLLINTWDRCREPALKVFLCSTYARLCVCVFTGLSTCLQMLCKLPAPLVGISSAPGICSLFNWTVFLCRSPRLRECDAGARMLKVVFSR